MYELEDLLNLVNPRQTILLLGAGDSIPSGAPSVESMKRRLAAKIPS